LKNWLANIFSRKSEGTFVPHTARWYWIVILLPVLAAYMPCYADAGAGAEMEKAATNSTGDFEDFDDDFDDEENVVEAYDPLEIFNRGMFWVNDKLYFYLLKPAARVFRIIPQPVRVSIANFFNNIETPIRLVNAAAQLKWSDAGHELERFAINTTVGIGGLFDPAKSRLRISPKIEDSGQTMGHYGVGAGPYLVIPIIGPSTLRDGIGRVADYYLHPVTYIVDDFSDIVIIEAIDVTNTLSLDKDTYEAIKKDALDPYLFIRDAYLQRRRAQVAR